jgi:hypothetical protein
MQILTERPANMTYAAYKKQQKAQKQWLKEYRRNGQMFWVSCSLIPRIGVNGLPVMVQRKNPKTGIMEDTNQIDYIGKTKGKTYVKAVEAAKEMARQDVKKSNFLTKVKQAILRGK